MPAAAPVAPPLLGRLRAALVAPVDAASLAAFRVAFGALMVWEVSRFFTHGWVARYYVEPAFHFTYFGFGWVRPWPAWGMYAHFVVLGGLAAAIAVGYRYRAAAALFTVGFAYVFLLDQARYLNHFYLITLLSGLMAVVPAHRTFSLDGWLGRSNASAAGPAYVPAWSLWLLRGQLAVVYLYAGLAKVNPDWLAGEPMRTWLLERAHYPVLGPLLDEAWAGLAFSWGGLAFDLVVVPLLLWRRTRLPAVGLALGFHLLNAWLFQIGVFPWMMIAATTLFFTPDWPRRAWRRLAPGPRSEPGVTPVLPAPTFRLARAGVRLAFAYALVQLALPLRHLAYPGEVHWTEEGHRFSWRMKLRDKDARALFLVTDPASGRTTLVAPSELIAPWQEEEMASRPDMVLQLARHLADRHAAEHGRRPGVTAEVWASLNSRPERLLIAPDVDLAAVPRTLRHAPWILRPEEPLAPPAVASAEEGR